MSNTKAKVIEMFEKVARAYPTKAVGTWHDTPHRRLARERNWCHYVLRGAQVLCIMTLKKYRVSPAAIKRLDDAITSMYFSVDKAYYDHIEQLEERGKRARATKAK